MLKKRDATVLQPSLYEKDEYYRPGLSEKREAWRYATKIYQGSSTDPTIGPYQVGLTELVSSGLEWLEHEPETFFVEVPAFAEASPTRPLWAVTRCAMPAAVNRWPICWPVSGTTRARGGGPGPG